jgi:hypothetical protein
MPPGNKSALNAALTEYDAQSGLQLTEAKRLWAVRLLGSLSPQSVDSTHAPATDHRAFDSVRRLRPPR